MTLLAFVLVWVVLSVACAATFAAVCAGARLAERRVPVVVVRTPQLVPVPVVRRPLQLPVPRSEQVGRAPVAV